MLRRSALFILILSAAFSFASAQEKPAPERSVTFIELWNNAVYYDTKLERKGFAALAGRFEGKAGLNVLNSPLQLYGVYYGSVSQSSDYWNNALISGVGARFKPLEKFASSGWMNEWVRDIKIFGESLSARYLMNAASAEAAGLKERDTRYGIEVWHEWNLSQVDPSVPWGELWSSLSVRGSNFGTQEASTTIFYFQPRYGRHLAPGVEVYLLADLTYSDREDYWLNMLDYGVGIRFAPWRSGADVYGLFRNFKMFAELLGASYLKGQPVDPAKQVLTDARFGIDFSYGR